MRARWQGWSPRRGRSHRVRLRLQTRRGECRRAEHEVANVAATMHRCAVSMEMGAASRFVSASTRARQRQAGRGAVMGWLMIGARRGHGTRAPGGVGVAQRPGCDGARSPRFCSAGSRGHGVHRQCVADRVVRLDVERSVAGRGLAREAARRGRWQGRLSARGFIAPRARVRGAR